MTQDNRPFKALAIVAIIVTAAVVNANTRGISTQQALTAAPVPVRLDGGASVQGSSRAFAHADHIHAVGGVLPLGFGGTGVSSATDDSVLLGNGTNWVEVPVANTAAGYAMIYNSSTNAFSNTNTISSAAKASWLTADAVGVAKPSSIAAHGFIRPSYGYYDNASGTRADEIQMSTAATDGGGRQNMISCSKGAIACRAWQGDFGSTSPFSEYRDFAFTDGTIAFAGDAGNAFGLTCTDCVDAVTELTGIVPGGNGGLGNALPACAVGSFLTADGGTTWCDSAAGDYIENQSVSEQAAHAWVSGPMSIGPTYDPDAMTDGASYLGLPLQFALSAPAGMGATLMALQNSEAAGMEGIGFLGPGSSTLVGSLKANNGDQSVSIESSSGRLILRSATGVEYGSAVPLYVSGTTGTPGQALVSQGDGGTPLWGNPDYAVTAGYCDEADYAADAGYAIRAGTADLAAFAGDAGHANVADLASDLSCTTPGCVADSDLASAFVKLQSVASAVQSGVAWVSDALLVGSDGATEIVTGEGVIPVGLYVGHRADQQHSAAVIDAADGGYAAVVLEADGVSQGMILGGGGGVQIASDRMTFDTGEHIYRGSAGHAGYAVVSNGGDGGSPFWGTPAYSTQAGYAYNAGNVDVPCVTGEVLTSDGGTTWCTSVGIDPADFIQNQVAAPQTASGAWLSNELFIGNSDTKCDPGTSCALASRQDTSTSHGIQLSNGYNDGSENISFWQGETFRSSITSPNSSLGAGLDFLAPAAGTYTFMCGSDTPLEFNSDNMTIVSKVLSVNGSAGIDGDYLMTGGPAGTLSWAHLPASMLEVDSASDTAIPNSSTWTAIQGLSWAVLEGQRTGFDCTLVYECVNTEARYAFTPYGANDKDDVTHYVVEWQTEDNDVVTTALFDQVALTGYGDMPLTANCTAAGTELQARIRGRILVDPANVVTPDGDETIYIKAIASGFGITIKKASWCEYYIK